MLETTTDETREEGRETLARHRAANLRRLAVSVLAPLAIFALAFFLRFLSSFLLFLFLLPFFLRLVPVSSFMPALGALY